MSNLMDDLLSGGGVRGVQDLPQQQRFQSLPDHVSHGTGVHVAHQAVTERSCNTSTVRLHPSKSQCSASRHAEGAENH